MSREPELVDVLTPQRVLILESTAKADVLRTMADCLATAPEIQDSDALIRGIFHREELMSTGIGKFLGAYIGARLTGSEPVVRRYLGLGLFAQGGVAIGLSIMASHYLAEVPVDDYLIYPVVDRDDRMVGVLSLDALKDVLTNPDSWTWLLVSDVMKPVMQKISSLSPLREVLDSMYELNVDQIPVVATGDGEVPVGLLDRGQVKERIDVEVFRRRQALEFKRSKKKKDEGDNHMAPQVKLGNMRVRDMKSLLITDSVVTNPDKTVEELLSAMVENPHTRHVYVVDPDGRLVGAVRMNDVIKYLFPYEAVVESSTELSVGQYAYFEAKTVGDIMDDGPRFVKEATLLSDMANILMLEKINELPVVDDQMHLVGQISIYEVLVAYLKDIRAEQAKPDRDTNTGNKP